MRRAALVLALALAALPVASGARAADRAGVAGLQLRYWSFTDGNAMRDPIVYFAPGPFHIQLEVWDFQRGQDQFRPEIGLHFRDRRRSVTTVQWRHERLDERFWLGTEQVLNAHWVGRAEISPIVATGITRTVVDAGLDYYWASYSLAGVTVIRDPREDGLWVVPVRARFANERNDWLQLTLAPASRRTIGWAADAKIHWLKLGVERNSRYDFTTLDNTIFTVGVEFPLAVIR